MTGDVLYKLETLYNDEAFAVFPCWTACWRKSHKQLQRSAIPCFQGRSLNKSERVNNVDGLIDKSTIDLEDHYKNKLLSLPDGSFDGPYRQRFTGRCKDGGTGFKVPHQEERDSYFHSVEQFVDVFTVESWSESDIRWTNINKNI